MRRKFFAAFRRISLSAIVALLIFIPLREVSAQTCVQPPSGLVSWWPGDGNALDIVGPNNGSLVGGVTFSTGKVDQAFSLDGVSGIVDLGPNNIIGSGTASFSVAFWMRPTAVPTLHYMPIRLKQDTQFFFVLTRDDCCALIPGDYVAATFRDQPQDWWIPTNQDSLVNQWTHATVIYNGGDKATASSYEIFFNGIQLPFGTLDVGHVGVACNDNAIGSDVAGACPGSNYSFFPGLLDEIQVFNRALSPAEVQTIYNAGGAGLCKGNVVVRLAFLRGSGPVANPPILFLDTTAPTATTAKYKDSASLNFNGGNPWKGVGTWTDETALLAGTLQDLGDLRVWLGLKNSDDQGTQFDLRAEVWKNGTELIAVGEALCITGVTRNPANAKEVTITFAPFAPVEFDNMTDELSLKVLTRIGTNPDSTKCSGLGGSHNNAVGLRVYFDAASRASQFEGTFAP